MRLKKTNHRLATFAVGFVLIAGLPAMVTAEPDDCPRDWSGIDLAWRGDPRAVSDSPGDLGRPMSRRAARRARRAAARGWRMAEPEADVAELPAFQPEAEQGSESPAFSRLRDIPYGGLPNRDEKQSVADHPRRRFDLFLPGKPLAQTPAARPLPVVIWIHGETWRDGSKADCPLTWLVAEGYAVASIGYRLTDTAVFPAQLDDCLAAVDHLRANAATWNLDPTRFAIAGSAAGGHLAALVGLSEESTDASPKAGIRGVCVVSAPTLLTTLGPSQDRPGSPASLLVGGPLPEFREAAQRASPLTHVSADAPPFLIIHAKGSGSEANGLPAEQSRQFDEALRAAGTQSTLVVVDRQNPRTALDRGSQAAIALLEFLRRAFSADPGA